MRRKQYEAFPAFGDKGFTFIEILVVLFVIGLIVSLVVINLDDDIDEIVFTEARRFAALVELARDESITQGKAYGVGINTVSHSYDFTFYDDGWQLLDRLEGELRPRVLTRDVQLKVIQSELDLPVNNPNQTDSEDSITDEQQSSGGKKNVKKSIVPRIMISPVGQVTGFEIEFFLEDVKYFVTPNSDNRIEVKTPDDA